MSSDVKLQGEQVIIEAWDMVLRSKDRLTGGTPPDAQRRALVHDHDDGLTVNWGADYPGGVTIQGEVTANDLHSETITLAGSLIVPLTFNLNTGEITAPSEIDSGTVRVAIENAVNLNVRAHPSGAVMPARGGRQPAGRSGGTPALSLSESRAALANAGVRRVDSMVLPIDLVKMVVDLAEEVEKLKKQVAQLEGG